MAREITKFEEDPEIGDLTNEDVVVRILEEGDPQKLEALRAFHNLTPEQIELFRTFAELRKSTLEQTRQEVEERVKRNPRATQEELSLGAYWETIEPQVRSAVLNLRQKGYTTYESGFYGFNSQKISFKEDHLKGFELSQDLAQELQKRGIDVKIKPNSISFSAGRFLEIDELRKIWDQLESALPDLEKPAEPSSLQAAENFRRKQRELE